MTDREKVLASLKACAREDTVSCEKAGCKYCEEDDCSGAMARDVLELLKKQESEWLEDSDPGQEYGTTWACLWCMHSIHEPFIWNPYDSGYKYCPHCGAEMKAKLDD